jgi:glycosyltransferase involved in cell wall biosynthesis
VSKQGFVRSRRIAVVISTLALGGAQRTVTLLAREWTSLGHEVEIVTLDDGRDDWFGLDEDVAITPLDVMQPTYGAFDAVRRNVAALRRLRRALRSSGPDVVISFIDRTNVLCVLATAGTSLPVIACERTNPTAAPLPAPWRILRDLAYRRAALVAFQTSAAEAWARRHLRVRRTVVLRNPTDLPGDARPKEPVIAGLGRLAPEKDFARLIRAFERLRAPAWRLELAGDGPLRSQLEHAARSGSAAARISILGPVPAATVLSGASIFALTSQFEGYPNALVEAMAHGCAVVSVDCAWGPGEIVEDGVDGLLVAATDASDDAFATALQRLVDDESLRRRLGDTARAKSARHGAGTVAVDWMKAIEALLGSQQ